MTSPILDEFSLDWIRSDRKEKLSKVHPEADAFQQMCGNILCDPVYKEFSGLNLNLVSFPTQGADGAIDHFAFMNPEDTTIIECKKNNSVDNCLDEIDKLKEKLLRNLGKKGAEKTLYAPWFNKKLKRYIYCTSCRPSNALAYEKIDDAIKKMMRHVSALNENLTHLKTAEIEVYTWSQLSAWLERSPFLLYQWVQPRIEGVEYISEEIPYIEGYRSYLSSNKIPYVRRDNYIDRHPEINDLPSEKKYIDELISTTNNNYKGLIIYGEGGIGKTRLMRELALMGEKKGWQSYKINALADFKELVSFLKPTGKYLLLFDYIEELPEFHDWAESLTQKERAFEVKIIANCRGSYISNVRVFSSSQFIKLDISNSTKSSRLYYREVVNEIIRDIPALKKVNNKIFEYRPSFAVFVRYLFDRDKRYDFDLRQDEDFRSWIIRRLGLSFNKLAQIKPDKELLAKLFACLPTQGKGKEFLEDNYTGEINTLINDGWFENRNEFGDTEPQQLAVIHDTLSDEVLLEYLERNKHTLSVVVRKFFDFAAKNYLVYGCMRAFERISDSSLLSNVDFVSAISKVIEAYPEQMSESYYHLVKTSLISEEEMIPLYFKHQEFFISYIQSSAFAGPLSFLLNDFSKKVISEQTHLQISKLYDWWHQSNNETILLNRYASNIISTSIKFFGPTKRQQKHLETYLENSSSHLEASFVIGAWLEGAGEKTVVEKHLLNWLQQHGSLFEARFLIGEWLSAGGDKSLVEKHLQEWLKQHGNNIDASFVIGEWLEAGGDKTLVEKHIQEWLKQHGNDIDASFVIGKWLETGGDKTLVEKHLLNWLKQNDTPEARFVIYEWLKAGGDKSLIQPSITNWLNHHDAILEARFVMEQWVKTGGDKTVVEKHMSNWLTQHDSVIEASFIMQEWLAGGGDKALVERHIANWLKEHNTVLEASFVIGEWLKAGGNKALVKSYIPNWLKQHSTVLEARYVIGEWLKARGDKLLVQSYIPNWLKQQNTGPEARFVIEEWLEAGGDKTLIQSYMLNWLKYNDTTLEASFLIKGWLENTGDFIAIENAAINWLNINASHANASHVFQSYLKAGGKPIVIEKPFAIWLDKNELKLNSFYSIGLWLRQGGKLNVVRFYVAEYLDKFSNDPKASYLLNNWMDVGGEVPIQE
jgi:hypothetical protein